MAQSKFTAIPKYHSKDMVVMVMTMLPMATLLNYFLWNNRLFERLDYFLIITAVTFLYLSIAFITYGGVAIFLRNRLPSDREFFKRMLICLGVFYLMSAAYISILLFVYDRTGFMGYQYQEVHFIQAYICFVVINTFLTFLNEGIYRFDRYKLNLEETEKLKTAYKKSQLLGLKSQSNPHFLFNSLNTLSSLIQEDTTMAENFLDHMSKVYRYLLRNNDEQFVTLQTEMSFIHSYQYLWNQRLGEGLWVSIKVREEVLNELLPPLTLQMIMENCINQNTASRENPLYISVREKNGWLLIKNNIQPKLNCPDTGEALSNITSKYRLLCQKEILVKMLDGVRVISLPLIKNEHLIPA